MAWRPAVQRPCPPAGPRIAAGRPDDPGTGWFPAPGTDRPGETGVAYGDVTANAQAAQGWYRDPFGVHEDRYFSEGRPTKLVRDGRAETYDEPPGTPFAAADLVPADPEPDSFSGGSDLRRADDAERHGESADLRRADESGLDGPYSADDAWHAVVESINKTWPPI